MKNKERFSPPAVGFGSVLTIFTLLLLTVFALLSLSTALSQKRLADASAEAATAYFQADLEAERIYARIRSGEIPPEVTESEGIFQYSCPVSGQQTLEVELTWRNGEWIVLRWQTMVLPQQLPEETLPVWDGQTAMEGTYD